MKAIQFHEYGGPEKLVLEVVEKPSPSAGHVLVKMYAAGVNPFDWKLRAGFMKSARPLHFPHIPGVEGAGIVEAVGENVTDVHPGDKVYGSINHSYAEYATISADQLQIIPENISMVQAAGISTAVQTAYSALFEMNNVQAGQRILIQGGSGAVGSAAVELAKWKGATVYATASTENVGAVKDLGADQVIDYRKERFEEILKDIDLVLDTAGGETTDRSFAVLKKGGVLISTANFPSKEKAEALGVKAMFRNKQISTEGLSTIRRLVEEDIIHITINRIFPLAEAADAHAFGQEGKGRGKIILEIQREF